MNETSAFQVMLNSYMVGFAVWAVVMIVLAIFWYFVPKTLQESPSYAVRLHYRIVYTHIFVTMLRGMPLAILVWPLIPIPVINMIVNWFVTTHVLYDYLVYGMTGLMVAGMIFRTIAIMINALWTWLRKPKVADPSVHKFGI